MTDEGRILLPLKSHMLCVGRFVEGEISIVGNHRLQAPVAWIIPSGRGLLWLFVSYRHRGCSSGVEHNLAKVGVEGSNPFTRSILRNGT